MSNGAGTKGAATSKAMGALHDQLAQELCDLIKNGEEIEMRGKKVRRKASAAVLNVARGFLKDNNVTCDEGSRPTGPIVDLEKALDELNEDDGAPTFTN
jgi:hypothetical protein